MKFFLIVAIFLVSSFPVLAQDEQAARVAEIQAALQKENFDGWLFYDFRGSDILTPRILKTDAAGRFAEVVLLHSSEGRAGEGRARDRTGSTRFAAGQKACLPRMAAVARTGSNAVFGEGKSKGKLRIAMQYSPNNDIPYISQGRCRDDRDGRGRWV